MVLKQLLQILVVAAVVSVSSTHVVAQDSSTTPSKVLKIAVIDMKTVRQQSTALTGIRSQISAYRETFQKEVQAEEESLRAANQELARQRSILGAEAFAEERRKFEERLTEVQRKVQKRRQDLELAREQAAAKVQSHLNEIITAIANERGIGLIFPRAQTVLAIKSLEITDDVLSRLNASLPSIDVQPPGQ